MRPSPAYGAIERSPYESYPPVARALAAGATVDPADLRILGEYLDDPAIPAWALRRIITQHLPASETVLAKGTRRNGFIWARDGEQLLASTPDDQEPRPTAAILPTICTRSAVAPRPD